MRDTRQSVFLFSVWSPSWSCNACMPTANRVEEQQQRRWRRRRLTGPRVPARLSRRIRSCSGAWARRTLLIASTLLLLLLQLRVLAPPLSRQYQRQEELLGVKKDRQGAVAAAAGVKAVATPIIQQLVAEEDPQLQTAHGSVPPKKFAVDGAHDVSLTAPSPPYWKKATLSDCRDNNPGCK